MSLATLGGELRVEFEHMIDRLIDRIEGLGLDPDSPEVLAAIEAEFGATVRAEFEDAAGLS